MARGRVLRGGWDPASEHSLEHKRDGDRNVVAVFAGGHLDSKWEPVRAKAEWDFGHRHARQVEHRGRSQEPRPPYGTTVTWRGARMRRMEENAVADRVDELSRKLAPRAQELVAASAIDRWQELGRQRDAGCRRVGTTAGK
jgi:hypothetical protein